MTHKGVRSRAAGIFAGAGALSLLLGGAALLVAPQANADQATNGHNPPGNNSTIKIEGEDISTPPDNNPHQGCTFQVEFYNYDKGAYYADVTFTDQAPTKDGGVHVVSGDTHPFIGGDDAGGGNDLDARVEYTVAFTGEPQPQQGYHIKITVEAPGSIGHNAKYKVFWVQGCEAPPTTPPTTPPATTDTPPATTDTPPATTDTPPATTDTPPATTDTPPATTDTPPATTDTPPATTGTPPATTGTPPATTPASPGTSESPSGTPSASTSTPAVGGPSETPTGGVPTEVDAGFGGSAGGSLAGSNSPFGLVGGLLLAAGGAMLAGAGFVALRRRGKHSQA
ncbi:MAG TPA: hypothetical protein VGN37_19520 [Actinocatenispora sp.]|uniref:LPXTG-motif cell wall-anchored protein n=1 Tax=Kribbella karoonensis TaxID=324851 RepID=A0ABP4PH09_9ACTN